MNDETDRINGLDHLARARKPARDLWPGIEARLAPRRSSRYGWAQMALAASLVAGLAGVFAVSLDRGAGPAAQDIATLSFGQALTADSRAIVKANLSLVEQAERELRHALEQKPESQPLRQLLARTENRQRALRALL